MRYELERLRCNLCGKIQTAELPDDAGESKYDRRVASVIGTLRYGLGMPWTRIERLQQSAGIPFACSTQWEVVRDAIDLRVPSGCGAVYRQLIVEAAQGQLFYNDDTSRQILEPAAILKKGEPMEGDAPERTGVCTTSILSVAEGRGEHCLVHHRPQRGTLWVAGENLREALQGRLTDLPPPLQMTGALSRGHRPKVGPLGLGNDRGQLPGSRPTQLLRLGGVV